jgi:hypothetical protein
MTPEKLLYAKVHATGGRDGGRPQHRWPSGGQLSVPGAPGTGTNPEQSRVGRPTK